MAGEYDNLPTGGTDSAALTSIDNPANWNYADPDDEQDTGEAQAAATDSEADETVSEDTQAVEAAPEEDGQQAESDDDEPEAKADPEAKVKLPTGEEIALSEAIKGYMRQADYSRKTAEAANDRKALAQRTEELARVTDAFVDYLAKAVPDAPDMSLLYTNPQQYHIQKAQHETALAKVQELVAMAKAPKEMQQALSQEDREALLMRENAALAEKLPATATEKGRGQVFSAATEAARELGYTDADIKGTTDHRMIALAYWAKRGMDAEKAKAIAARKVANVPPVPTPKAKAAQGTNVKNKIAMDRLSKTGSIYDAMKIDFV